jgi:hypothetical protein
MTTRINKDNKDSTDNDNNNKFVTKEELNILIKNLISVNELRREADESKKEINDNYMMLGNKNITRRTSGIHPFDNFNTPDKINIDKAYLVIMTKL